MHRHIFKECVGKLHTQKKLSMQGRDIHIHVVSFQKAINVDSQIYKKVHYSKNYITRNHYFTWVQILKLSQINPPNYPTWCGGLQAV